MHEISIEVKGAVAQGKTTIAFAITKALQDLGFDVSLLDDNGVGIVDENAAIVTAGLEGRITRLAGRQVKIKVRTQQTTRKSS